jgi:hypothetical protein
MKLIKEFRKYDVEKLKENKKRNKINKQKKEK